MTTSRLLSFVLLFLTLPTARGQFGEIASIVTGLLGPATSGAASGAAGLGGLGSLAGAGAAAGTGAAGAIGNIGQLYQLAQAALQLTGTGVGKFSSIAFIHLIVSSFGIVNQASESAWFPAAVENAARMNREFQDRLLAGGPNGAHGTKPAGGSRPSGGAAAGGLPVGGFPDLFGINRPHGMGAGGSEIGTEFGKELTSHETEEKETAGSTDPPPATEEPDPLPAQTVGGRALPGLLPDLHTLLPGEAPTSGRSEGAAVGGAAPSPKITVQLPEEKDEKPQMEFSIDSTEDSFPLLPPHASSPDEKAPASGELRIDEKMIPHMVPELQKLLRALQKSNLTRADLEELSAQLEGNKKPGQPRENTTPEPSEIFLEHLRTDTPEDLAVNEDRKKAVDRNLYALRRALTSPTVAEMVANKFANSQHTPPVVIALERPTLTTATRSEVKPPAASRSTTKPPTSAAASSPPISSIAPRAHELNGVSQQRVTDSPTASTRIQLDSETATSKKPQSKGAKNIARPTPIVLTPDQQYAKYKEDYMRWYSTFFANRPTPQPVGQQLQPTNSQPAATFHYYGQQTPSSQLFYPNQQQPNDAVTYGQQPPFVVAQQQPAAPAHLSQTTYPLQHPWSHGTLLTVPQSPQYHQLGRR